MNDKMLIDDKMMESTSSTIQTTIQLPSSLQIDTLLSNTKLKNTDQTTVIKNIETNDYSKSEGTNNIIGAEDSLRNDSIANQLIFDLPNWGIEDYIGDRTKWVKGIRSIGDEPGFFYLKTFFKFDTNYGLFGGILSENGNQLMSSNSALRYLNNIKGSFVRDDKGENSRKNIMFYDQEQIPMRINALLKFTSGLSKINSDYPWIIKGVNGLENAMNNYVDNFTEEKSFELIFNTESTDMKLINLLNLYKYACFDDINCKEIIPANLRKFDMMIIIYHVPLKYFQTGIMTSPKNNLKTYLARQGSDFAKAENIISNTVNFLTTKSTFYKYKRMHPENQNYSNMMSFQMFTFQNCEFDVASFGNYFSGTEIKNEQAFQFFEIPIKIKYDRVYYHNMNEWNQMLYGSDGFIYDVRFPDGSELPDSIVNKIRGKEYDNLFNSRLKSIKDAKEGARFFDRNATQYKSIIDYAESMITDGLMSMDMKDYYSFTKGNIYGSFANIDSEYYANKTKVLKDGNIKGNIYGKKISPNNDKSGYFNKKIELLKKGTIKGNLYGKKFEQSYIDKKIKLMNDGIVNPGEIRQELQNEYQILQDNELAHNGNYININDLFEKIPNYPYERNPIETQRKDIWNYMADGTSKNGMFSGLVEDVNRMSSFWRF